MTPLPAPRRCTAAILGCLALATGLAAHPAGSPNRPLQFPDLPGYATLLADLHQHTVFSDGEVWPSLRVKEAVREGLDVIAISDHLEWLPHRDDIPFPDRNRPFEIAREAARESGLMVLNGAEVTRSLPPGHCNAVFLEDANGLLRDDPIAAFREARRQGAFIFWNHPSWVAQQPDGMAVLTDLHRQLIDEGLLHGIEVVNEHTFSAEALQIALDHNLAILGNSDIHGLVDWEHAVPEGGHRPVTLVFAREPTEAALREALFAGRTAVVFKDTVIGKTEFVAPLIEQAVIVEGAEVLQSRGRPTFVVEVSLRNRSSIDFVFENRSGFSLHNHADVITLPAGAATTIEIKVRETPESFVVPFRVLNAVTAPRQHPTVAYRIPVPFRRE